MGILKVKEDPPPRPRLQVKDTAQEPQPESHAAAETHADNGVAPPSGPRRTKSAERPKKADIPQAPEMEKALLSAMLFSPKTAIPATQQLIPTAKYFFSEANRTIYKALCTMWKEEGQLDGVAFTQYLEDHKLYDQIGGKVYLWSEIIGHPAPEEMIGYYVGILREKYLSRSIYRFATDVMKGGDPNALLVGMGDTFRYLQSLNNTSALCDAASFLNGECPELPIEIVYNLLHVGSKMIVGGTSKGRKTMALIDLALSVATGAPWWGFVTKRSKVCYINFELQDGFFWYRSRQICAARQLNVQPGMLYAWNLRGRADAIENLLEEILSVLKRVSFGLAIIDPIYKALGGRDENRAGDVAQMLNEVEKIAVQTGAAVAFGAHYSKGNQSMKDSMDRIGGSGVFARDPDTILTMTAHEEEDCFSVESTLRNFAPMRPFVVRWGWPLFVRDELLDPNDLKRPRGGKSGQFEKQYSEELLLELLKNEGPLQPKKACSMLKESKDISRRTVYNMKEKLDKSGKTVTNSEGLWSYIGGD